MSRLPAKTRDELSPEQHECHDLFRRAVDYSFGENGEKFIYEDKNGALIGPMPFFFAEPNLGRMLHDVVYGLAKVPLPPDARETAILVVGGHFQAGYETYSHVPQAVLPGYLTREQAETLKDGTNKPDGLNKNCSTAYDVASHLVRNPGPLPKTLWDASVDAFGKDGTVGLIHYIGFYCYVSVALNAMDAPVPE